MKIFAESLLILSLLAGVSGCASSYKHVLVSVVDSNTGEPVCGATVISTPYSDATWWSRHFYYSSKGVTDQTGKAMLKAKYEQGIEPLWEVDVVNSRYDQQQEIYPTLEETDGLIARPESFIPTTPDFVVGVTSRRDLTRSEAAAEEKRKSEDQAAETLLRDSPSFWPEHEDEPYPRPKNEVERLLVQKRWQRASKTPLGLKQDVDSIRAVVIRHMNRPSGKVEEIRWLSPTLVMVSCSWYTSPLAAASYTYVLQKDESGWAVLAYYMESIS